MGIEISPPNDNTPRFKAVKKESLPHSLRFSVLMVYNDNISSFKKQESYKIMISFY